MQELDFDESLLNDSYLEVCCIICGESGSIWIDDDPIYHQCLDDLSEFEDEIWG